MRCPECKRVRLAHRIVVLAAMHIVKYPQVVRLRKCMTRDHLHLALGRHPLGALYLFAYGVGSLRHACLIWPQCTFYCATCCVTGHGLCQHCLSEHVGHDVLQVRNLTQLPH
jgi:hypothetical protein